MNPCEPARSLKSLAEPGEWHVSSAQPRFKNTGMTKSSKNFSPSESVTAACDAPTSAAHFDRSFQVCSFFDAKKTPPVCTIPPPDGARGLSTIIEVSGGLPTNACASRKLNLEASLEPSPAQVMKKSDCSPEWQVENAQLRVITGSTVAVKFWNACEL